MDEVSHLEGSSMRYYYLQRIGTISIFLIMVLLFASSLKAHVEEPKDQTAIGIEQKLGQFVPLDLIFNDENADAVSLRQLAHSPTILVLVYYHCTNVCSFLLQNVADVLNRLPAQPGKEYTVLSISFDENEKPGLALQKKEIYLKMIEKPFPREAWRFLTGDKENIHKLTDAVGFHFKREGEDFQHPVSLIILSPEGKIVRYMFGTDLLPLDLKMALIESSQGRIGPVISKALRFCFSYDPKGKKLVFNTLKVTGSVTILFAVSFIIFLLFKGREQPSK
jgi:protein SCO1